MPYLLKTEPDKYSFDDLLRDGETTWDGIANNQALLTLRNMKKATSSSSTTPTWARPPWERPRSSPSTRRPEEPHRAHQAGQATEARKALAEMREAPVFQGSILFRQFRLSVVPLTPSSTTGSSLDSTATPNLHRTRQLLPFSVKRSVVWPRLQLKCPSSPSAIWLTLRQRLGTHARLFVVR